MSRLKFVWLDTCCPYTLSSNIYVWLLTAAFLVRNLHFIFKSLIHFYVGLLKQFDRSWIKFVLKKPCCLHKRVKGGILLVRLFKQSGPVSLNRKECGQMQCCFSEKAESKSTCRPFMVLVQRIIEIFAFCHNGRPSLPFLYAVVHECVCICACQCICEHTLCVRMFWCISPVLSRLLLLILEIE